MNWQRYQGENAWMRENIIESPEGYRIIRHSTDKFSAWQPNKKNGLTLFCVTDNSAAAKQACKKTANK